MTTHRASGGRLRRRWSCALVALAAALLASGCVAESTWTLQPVEQVQAPVASAVHINSVDCPAPGACIATAVLDHGWWPDEDAVLRQVGAGWQRLSLPEGVPSSFAGVSCRAVDDCLVVGEPLDVHVGADAATWVLAPAGAHADVADETVDCIAEGCLRVRGSGSWWWDGSAWGPRVELPEGFQPSERRLACTSPTQCMAVASQEWMHGSVEGPDWGPVTATVWDGASWSPIVSIGDLRGAALACPAVDSCLVSLGVRSSPQWPPVPPLFGPATRLVRWDGTSWSEMTVTWPGTAPTEPPMLACAGPSDCTFQTVRGWLLGGPDYLGRWDGATWSVTAVPAARWLDAMSCPAPGDCVAVGEANSQRLTGSAWADITPVEVAPQPSIRLEEVACATAEICVADGYESSAGDVPVYRVFDGRSWMAVDGASAEPLRIACAPEAMCLAASRSGVVHRWDGASLSAFDPIPMPAGSIVLDIDCPGAEWCMAIAGQSGHPSTGFSWSPGSGWTPLALPPDEGASLLARGVACDAPGSCLATSRTSAAGVAFHRLSGGEWTTLGDPPPEVAAAPEFMFGDVDCPTADTCVVVVGSSDDFTLLRAVLRGDTWDVSDSGQRGYDARVDCWSADGCVVSSPGGMATLQGTRWLAIGVPRGTGPVEDVSCPTAFTCEVVGPFADGEERSPAARLDLEPPD